VIDEILRQDLNCLLADGVITKGMLPGLLADMELSSDSSAAMLLLKVEISFVS
jgi:hypothetical protein